VRRMQAARPRMAPASGTAQMQQKHARASSEAHVLLMAMHNKNSRARAVLGLPDNVYPADLGAACAAQLGDWDLKPAAMNSARREKSNTKARQFRTYTADDIRDAPEIVPNAHIGAKAKTDREVLLPASHGQLVCPAGCLRHVVQVARGRAISTWKWRPFTVDNQGCEAHLFSEQVAVCQRHC